MMDVALEERIVINISETTSSLTLGICIATTTCRSNADCNGNANTNNGSCAKRTSKNTSQIRCGADSTVNSRKSIKADAQLHNCSIGGISV